MATRSVKFYLLVGLGKVELWTADPTAAHDILLRVREFETPEDIRLALGGFPPNVMTTNGDQWARHRRVVSTVIDKRISKNAFEESMRQTNSPLDELFSSPTGGKPDSTDTLQLFDMLKKVTIHGFLGAGMGVTPLGKAKYRDQNTEWRTEFFSLQSSAPYLAPCYSQPGFSPFDHHKENDSS
jgi:hypothetical protein